MLRVYIPQLQIGAKYIFYLRDTTRLSSTWKHPHMIFFNQKMICLITRWPTCLPLYINPLQDICMNTKMWAHIPDYGSMTFTVIHVYRKFIAKKNKWMGQCLHSKRCNILQRKSEKALLNENRLTSSVKFTIPSNGSTKHQFHEFSH